MKYRLSERQLGQLKDLFDRHGLVRKDLCAELEIDQSTLSRILSGNIICSWSRSDWTIIARHLNMNPETLLSVLDLSLDFRTQEAFKCGLFDPWDAPYAPENYSDDRVLKTYDTISEISIPPVLLSKPLKGDFRLRATFMKGRYLEPRINYGDLVIINTHDRVPVDDDIYAVITSGVFGLRIASSPQAGYVRWSTCQPEKYPVISERYAPKGEEPSLEDYQAMGLLPKAHSVFDPDYFLVIGRIVAIVRPL